jgi:hypothetical protein
MISRATSSSFLEHALGLLDARLVGNDTSARG